MVSEPTDAAADVEDETSSPVSFAETALRLGGKSDEEALIAVVDQLIAETVEMG